MSVAGGLADLLVRASLLLALVWLAAAGVRKAGGSAAMRHMIWLLGLGALLLLPLLAALMPPLQPAGPARDGVAAAAGDRRLRTDRCDGRAQRRSAARRSASAILFELLYLAVAAGLLGRLALGHVAARAPVAARAAGGGGALG